MFIHQALCEGVNFLYQKVGVEFGVRGRGSRVWFKGRGGVGWSLRSEVWDDGAVKVWLIERISFCPISIIRFAN